MPPKTSAKENRFNALFKSVVLIVFGDWAMYYKAYHRIKRTQDLLDKVVYVSMGSDILIAASTYLVLRNVAYSNYILLLSDYMDFLFVAVAVPLFLALVILRHGSDLPKKARMLLFKLTHKRYHPI